MTATASARSLVRSASIISSAYIISRFLGYVREALLAARFGATHTTDAYLVAQELPNSLFAAITAALLMVFIPVYREVVHRRGEAEGWRLVSTVLNATLLVAGVLVVLGMALAPFVVPRLVPGLPDPVIAIAVSLTRVTLPMMLFLGAGGVAAAVLNANRHFTAPALVGLASNIVVIGVLLVIRRTDQIFWVAWATVAGAAVGLLIQVPVLPQLGFRLGRPLEWGDPALLQIGRLIIPVAMSAGAIQLQNLADRWMASHLAEGSISALNYAVRLNSLPYGVIGASIATVLYPGMAESAAAGRLQELRSTVAGGLRTLSYVLFPMSFGLLAFREPIVRLFFQRGAFDPTATAMTAYALAFYAAGILFFGWLDLINRSFFALQDSMTPMWAGLGMVVLNIALNVLLVRPLAIGGLALGTSLSTAVAVGFLLWRLQLRVGGLEGSTLARAVVSNLVTAAAGTLAGILAYRLAARAAGGPGLTGQALRLGTGLLTVVAVHVVFGLLIGNREGQELLARVRLRLKPRSGDR